MTVPKAVTGLVNVHDNDTVAQMVVTVKTYAMYAIGAITTVGMVVNGLASAFGFDNIIPVSLMNCLSQAGEETQ